MQIKDSGQRRVFSTGAQRDRGDLKPRPDLIHPYFLMRFGMHMARGAKKYSDWNWAKGMPMSEWFASMYRHLVMAMLGDESEDHLSALCFNAMGAMVTQEGIYEGMYPAELFDLFPFQPGWSDMVNGLTESVPNRPTTTEVCECEEVAQQEGGAWDPGVRPPTDEDFVDGYVRPWIEKFDNNDGVFIGDEDEGDWVLLDDYIRRKEVESASPEKAANSTKPEFFGTSGTAVPSQFVGETEEVEDFVPPAYDYVGVED